MIKMIMWGIEKKVPQNWMISFPRIGHHWGLFPPREVFLRYPFWRVLNLAAQNDAEK